MIYQLQIMYTSLIIGNEIIYNKMDKNFKKISSIK